MEFWTFTNVSLFSIQKNVLIRYIFDTQCHLVHLAVKYITSKKGKVVGVCPTSPTPAGYGSAL